MQKEIDATRQEKRKYKKKRYFLLKKKSNSNSGNKNLNGQVKQLKLAKWKMYVRKNTKNLAELKDRNCESSIKGGISARRQLNPNGKNRI